MQSAHDVDHTDANPDASGLTARERLAALERTQLMDSPPEVAFDRLTRLACRFLDVPVSLVSLVDDHRQFFKSQQGLPEPWASRRETPLSHSFCQHVVTSDAPLVLEDARDHPMVCDNLAIRDLDVIAYLGIPLKMPDGQVLGSLCAIDGRPRPWNDEDVETLTELAGVVMNEIQLRMLLRERRNTEEALAAANRSLEARVRERTDDLEYANMLLQQRNQELQHFAYLASHDLQEPLRKISAFSDLLREDFPDRFEDAAGDYLKRIAGSAHRMRRLLQDLLSFSRIVTHLKPMKQVRLSVVWDRVVSELQPLIREQQADVQVDVQAAGLPVIEADEEQVRQLLRQLLHNALTFRREEAPPRVRLEAAVDGTWCKLTMRDNGLGFEERFVDRIFRPFERLHGRSRFSGTGMGLAICRRIVERHDGTIAAESTPGEGSVFTVRLPVRQSDQTRAGHPGTA